MVRGAQSHLLVILPGSEAPLTPGPSGWLGWQMSQPAMAPAGLLLAKPHACSVPFPPHVCPHVYSEKDAWAPWGGMGQRDPMSSRLTTSPLGLPPLLQGFMGELHAGVPSRTLPTVVTHQPASCPCGSLSLLEGHHEQECSPTVLCSLLM